MKVMCYVYSDRTVTRFWHWKKKPELKKDTLASKHLYLHLQSYFILMFFAFWCLKVTLPEPEPLAWLHTSGSGFYELTWKYQTARMISLFLSVEPNVS